MSASDFLSNPILPFNSSDPSSPVEGEIWYNDTVEKLKFKNSAANRTLAIAEELASTSNALGASLIGVEDSGGKFDGSTVEAILAEIIDDYASTANGEGASLIGVEDSGANFTATNVEGVLTEIDARIDALSSGRDFVESVNLDMNYVKTTTGAPSAGTALVAGEILINTADSTYYIAQSSTTWSSATAIPTNMRAVWKTDGADNGFTNTSDGKIYQEGQFGNPYTPTEGSTFWHEYENKYYTFNGTAWVLTGSVLDHNTISGKQGGATDEYYHLSAADHTLVQNLDSTTNGHGASLVALDASSDVGTEHADVQAALEDLYDRAVNATDSYEEGATSVTGGNVQHVVTHNLGTYYVQLQAFKDDGGNPGQAVSLSWKPLTANTLEVRIANTEDLHFSVMGKE